jgi:hypothetical protein
MTHQFGIRNAQSSINYAIRTNLASYAPSWLSFRYGVSLPRSLNFNYPDQPLNFPSWSVTHHSSDPIIQSEGDKADGTYRGVIQQGLMEVSCWVLEIEVDDNGKPTGNKNEKWWSQLLDLRDAMVLLLRRNRSILMYDFADANNPVALTALIRLKDVHDRQVTQDPNPAVHRWMITASYTWVERWLPVGVNQ